MNSDYIQQLQVKLRRRAERLNKSSTNEFLWILTRTFSFLNDCHITKVILFDLGQRFPDANKCAEEVYHGKPCVRETDEFNAALSVCLLKKCIAEKQSHYIIKMGIDLGGIEGKDSLTLFREAYVDPLFDYIEEQIDASRLTLAILVKYKHRCEWFRRNELFEKYQSETSRGEERLAFDLYEYLHDQGLQFHIEPRSASGKVDLISWQTGKDRLVADVKIFDGKSRGSPYIICAFNQVYTYAKDYHETFGYLIIYKICEPDLLIGTRNQDGGVPFVTCNNKTIFFITIDLYPHAESASKRGRLQAIEITPEQLVKACNPAP
jgi:hypothetical protein